MAPDAAITGTAFDAVSRAQTVVPGGAVSELDSTDLAQYIRARAETDDVVTVGGQELHLEHLSPVIGTVVNGADLAKPLGSELTAFLRRLWLERRVIFFRGQAHLTREQHTQLAGQFGVLGSHHGERDWVPENERVSLERSTPAGFPDIVYIFADEARPNAASSWHSDVMWSPRPPMGSMLIARKVPKVGGDTCFCDMYAMWEGLRPETRRRLEGLRALQVGGLGHKMAGVIPSATHPCARTHPETGGTALYVAPSFTRRILGVPEKESAALLRECFAQAGRPEYSCRFHWEDGSLAFWDNRACLHYATPDFWPHKRHLERVTVLDSDESRKVPFFAPPSSKL